MKNSELLFNIVTGGDIPVADHPLFREVWDNAANAYNDFVEELDLNADQISKLRNLISWKCAIERLGYYTALQIGFSASTSDMSKAKILFDYMSMDESDKEKVFGFVKELSALKREQKAV